MAFGTPYEQDPNGVGQPDPKDDDGKPLAGLMLDDFAMALMEVAKVHTYGVNTYWEGSWKEVPNGEKRFKNARARHILQERAMYDDKTNLLHAAHVAWNSLSMLQLLLERLENGSGHHQSHS